jgi:hypothetical protein
MTLAFLAAISRLEGQGPEFISENPQNSEINRSYGWSPPC